MQSDSSRAGNVRRVNEQLRRRSVGAPAARSVLLTLLGEYVLPASGSAWQETLIAALDTFRAEIGDVGDPAKVVGEAWDLAAVAAAYRAFIARFGRLRPAAPEAIFRAQTQLVHEWRKFPFLDPDLPDDMLPPGWPRRRAHDLFQERHRQWHAAAQEHFRALEGSPARQAA